MKKVLKITAITLGSLVLAVLIAVGIIIALLFNTNVLADAVNKKASDFITCEYHIGKIEPSLFGSFPQFSISIEDLYLGDKMSEHSGNDTLAYVGKVLASVDVKRLLKEKELFVKTVSLENVAANVFVDSSGLANYDVFAFSADTVSEEDDTTSFSIPFSTIALDELALKNLNISYVDNQSRMKANLRDFDLDASLSFVEERLALALDMASPALSFALNDTLLVDAQPISFSLPLDLDLKSMHLNTEQLNLALGKIALQMDGQANIDSLSQDILCDLNLRVGGEKEPIANYLQLIPAAYAGLLDGIDVNGLIGLNAKVKGCYNENSMPLVDVDVQLHDANVIYQDLPEINHLQMGLTAHLDLNEPKQTKAQLHHLALNVNQAALNASATVEDLLSDNLRCKANASIDAQLAAWQDFLPDSIDVKGRVKADAHVALSLKDISNGLNNLKPIQLHTKVAYRDLDVAMGDIKAKSTKGTCQIDLLKKTELPISLKFRDCQALQVSMGDSLAADLQELNLNLLLSDVLADASHIKADAALDLGKAVVEMAGINAQTQGLALAAKADLSGEDYSVMKVDAKLSNQALFADLGEHQLKTGAINLHAIINQESVQENILHSLNPSLSMYLQSASFNTTLIPEEVQVADIQFDYANDKLQIQQSTVQFGNSDFHLDGQLSNIIAFLEEQSLLKAELNFLSNHTDVNRLMELTSGLGVDSTEMEIDEDEHHIDIEQDSILNEPNPFIVPKGVDVLFHTDIKEAVVGKQLAKNLSGNLYIRDGVMILEEIGFVCDAAKLQLTAMYRSPRPNHLYVGLDYHMVDIRIDELLSMVPQVDSVLPMLRSFRGDAEFHIAAETYLNARYELKKSTLRGAASIQGKDLVLLDGENFTEIAKILHFNKKTENVIDTVNAEITVFRNEVDIYPIQLQVDKYKAIVAGRHNLDMSFNYHASLVSPLRLGVDVSGTFDKLKIRPVPCRYTDQFHPAERRLVEQQQLSLRKIIQDSLIKDL